MEYKLTIKNRDKIMNAFRQAPVIAAEEFRHSLERIAAHVVSGAMRNAPVGHSYKGGGNLRQSIGYQPHGTGFRVYVNANYAAYVDQGTKPHEIRPRTRSMLAFQVDGKWVFAKRVRHPGTKATHFFGNAVKSGEAFAATEMPQAIKRVINRI